MSIKTTILIGLALVAIVIGIDVYLALDSVKNNTWSEIIREYGKKRLIIPWVLGGLGGHFFHLESIPKLPIEFPGNISILVFISLLVLGLGGILPRYSLYIPPAITFFVGFIVWSLLWPT